MNAGQKSEVDANGIPVEFARPTDQVQHPNEAVNKT